MRKAATFFLLGFVSALPGAETLTSGDAFVGFDSGTSTWILGTKVVEQRLQLEEGRFRLVSLRNRITGTDFVAAAGSDEFRFIFAGSERDGRTGGYALRDYRISRLPVPRSSPGIEPGLTLLIELEHPQFLLSLHYDVYASTPRTPLGMIRKWCRVTNHMRRFMLDREKRYGTYFYRLDGWVQAPCWAANHDHPAGQPHLQQYRHYLQLLREVKEANPGMGIQGCNSGGEWCNWDKLELVENNQTSDGGGPDDVYYLSYFWSVAKLMEWGAGSNGLPSAPDDPAIERLRRDILMRRYLKQEGVIGRYMRVYHPRAEGAPTPHTYLQVANAERTKAAIFQDAAPKGPAVVYPARLNPDTTYRVSFRFAKETQAATGAELMRKGIRFPPGPANEMALLNLENAPGRGMDRTPPSAPAGLTKKLETWGGRSGVALRWSPSRDNVIVAEYQVLRDGKPADHVAAGEFYFDAGAGLNSRYEVVAIDGDGNRSAPGGEKAAKRFKSP